MASVDKNADEEKQKGLGFCQVLITTKPSLVELWHKVSIGKRIKRTTLSN
jgi:hypothetical protein